MAIFNQLVVKEGTQGGCAEEQTAALSGHAKAQGHVS